MDLEALWQDLMATVRRVKAAGTAVTPDHMDEFVYQRSGGKVRSVDELKAALRQRDVAPGKAAGIARAAHQGLTFGWGDELSGAIDAALGGSYAETRDREREAADAFRATNPKTALAAEVAGSLLLPFGAAGTAARSASLGRMAVAGGLVGAGTGALAGAGASEATTPAGVYEDTKDAAGLGFGLGAGLGAAARPAAAMLGGVPHVLQDLLAPATAAERRATSGLARIIPEGADATARQMEQVRPGRGMVADLSPDMGDALRAATNKSSAVSQAVRPELVARGAGTGERLAEDLLQTAGLPGLNLPEVTAAAKNVVGRGRPLNQKLYGPLERLYPALTPSEETAPLLELLTHPEVEKIYAGVVGSGGRTGAPSFTQMQAVLHKLQDATSAAYRRGENNLASEMQTLSEQFSGAMEQAMPGFRAANRGYATAQHTLRAFDDGATAMSVDSRALAGMLARARKSGGEEAVTAFRMGALDKMAQDLRALATNRDAATRFTAMGPELEARLAQLFPSEGAMKRFLARADVERMFRTTQERVAGNSTTTLQSEMIGKITGTPTGLARGGREGVIDRALNSVDRTLFGDLPEQAATAAGARLTATGPRMREVLAELERVRAGLLAGDRRVTGIGARGLPAAAGTNAGLFGGQQ
jgi:hypothetical protein